MTRRVRLASLGIAAALSCAAAVPLGRVVPASAATWAISLAASATSVSVGSTVTLTASTNQNVSNAGYYIDVDDETTHSTVDFCGTGKSCQVPVSWSGAGSHTYVAYVDSDPYFEYPPCCVQATSNTVTVTWGQPITWSVSLASSATDASAGSTVTLSATTDNSVTGTGDDIAIFDETTGQGVVECAAGATCQGAATETAAGTHTFVAYVAADPVFEYPPCCVQAESNSAAVTWHAVATAAMSVSFQATGTLPAFPCPEGCSTTFAGSGVVEGTAQAGSGSDSYVATIAATAAAVSGAVSYAEPGFPFCPVEGSAAATVSIDAPASGTVQRMNTPTLTGTVTGIDLQLDITYERVGGTTAITVKGGTATISFTFPDTGPDYFVSSVSGAGLGVFVTSATDTALSCIQSARALAFTFAGETELVLS